MYCHYSLADAHFPSRWVGGWVSLSGWLHTKMDTRERSPISVLTGLDVEQLCWRDRHRYHWARPPPNEETAQQKWHKQHTDLFAELFFAELVQRVELLGEHEVLLEAAAGQLHADDDGAIRDHHRHRPEVDLEVLGQLLATRVAGILHRAVLVTRYDTIRCSYDTIRYI